MKSLLVVRKAGQQMPEAFRQKLIEQHPTGLGYASFQDTHVDNEIWDGTSADLADALNTVEKSYVDDEVVFWAVEANIDTEINVESCQPFNLITQAKKEGEKEDKVLLACFLEGEFPKYDGMNAEGEIFTPEYHCVNSFIKPAIDELYDVVGNNVEMLMRALEKPAQKAKFEAILGPRATILFVPHTGETKAITNAKEKAFPWGWVSRDIGYTESQAAPPVTARKGMRSASGEQPVVGPEKKETPPGGTPTNPEELYAPVLKADKHFFLNGSELWAKPDSKDGSGIQGHKGYWRTHSTLPIPEDPRSLYKGFPASALRPNSPLFKLVAELTAPKRAESEQGPAEHPGTQTKESPKQADKPTLLVSKEKKEKWVRMRDEARLTTSTVDQLKEHLSEYPLFSIQLGEDSAELLMLSPLSLIRLAHADAHMAGLLLHEFRCQAMDLKAEKPPVKEGEVVQPPAQAQPAAKRGMKEAARKTA